MKDLSARFQILLGERILILDGAMGTMIQRHGLSEADYRGERFADWPRDLKGNNDLLTLTQPQVIGGIHQAYLDAGADILETNTFNANRISMADYGMEDLSRELNVAAARLARDLADAAATPDQPRFVAGVLGPTNRTLSISPDVNDPGFRNLEFPTLVAAYVEAAEGLIEGGADLLLIETIFDTLNAKAAIVACEEVFEKQGQRLPVMISGTITDQSGRTLTGQTTEAFYNSLRHVQPVSIGLNCALGPFELRQYVAEMARIAETHVSAHPNAGLPNEMGGYDLGPAEMAREIAEWAEAGLLNIVGGCCGTSPDHIRAIAQAVAGKPPRRLPSLAPACRLSGLEPLNIDKALPSKWRRITVIKRQSVDTGQLQAARHLAKDVFGQIAPDGEDTLNAFLRDKLDGWRANLTQYQTLANTSDYPGSREIADALGVIAKLLAEKESFGLIGKFLERKADLLDLSDSVHELENFYDTQRPTWEKLRKAHTRFQLNRTWLDKDATAAAALRRIKEILAAAAPYGMIKEAESLIQSVESVNTALVTNRRDLVLQRIDAHIARIEAELDGAQASSDLRNPCLYPLQTLRRQVETQTSIAHINQAQDSAVEVADEAIDKIEAATKARAEKDIAEKKPPVYVKKRRIIQAARLAPKAPLETQADVDGYLERLRGELEAAISAGERIEIR